MSEVHVGRVDFKNGNPCEPRYMDLYQNQDSQADPLVQVEPAFQVAGSIDTLQVGITLAKGDQGDVVFTDERGRPLCRELNSPEIPTIEYTGGGTASCILTWSRRQESFATRVFRIYCQRRGQKPTDEEMVYGGIFVAITTSLSLMHRHIPHTPPNSVKLRNVVVIGTSQTGHPVFDVFKPRDKTGFTLPSGVELAPAYRAREGKALEFAMTMGIEDAIWSGKVDYIQPQGTKPQGLTERYNSEKPRKYHFRWQTPGRGCQATQPLESCYVGEIVTFHLQPEVEPFAADVPFPPRLSRAGFKGWDDYAAALKQINVDPTIIQPPPCDPVYRVCSD